MQPDQPPAADEAEIVSQILGCGEHLPDSTAEAIARLGGEVVPALTGLLENDELAQEGARGEGFGPVHAAKLLGQIGAPEAIEPLLRVLARCDPMELLYNGVIRALRGFGAAALEKVLEAYAASPSGDHREALADVLSGLEVRDPRIFGILLRTLDERMDLGAGLLVEYGDPAAVPPLGAALDRVELEDDHGLLANQDVIELAAAIEDLGGALTEKQERKVLTVRARRQAVRSMLEAIAGSGRSATVEAGGGAAANRRKKKLRKLRKQAQRRNRR
jgi:HEAT repeat protein